MTKWTQADFDSIRRDENGCKHVPYGDWTEVDFRGENKLIFGESEEENYAIFGYGARFGNYVSFGDCVSFGDWVSFGDCVSFGNCARFGDCVSFGNCARFGDWVRFGDGASFGNEARFGDGASFGNCARFGNEASFGNCARFGNEARFDDGASFENGTVKDAVMFFVSNIGSRNDCAYAFCNTKTGEIFIRAGCWFGNIDDFVARVKYVHGGTDHETDYLAFAELAKARFKKYNP